MPKTKKLWKTTIVIWSEVDARPDDMELSDLARDAEIGESNCSKRDSEIVDDPAADPDWDGSEFFNLPGDAGEEMTG